jgi:hypothetical protein
MNTTFQNSAQVLLIGIFCTRTIVGITELRPDNMLQGLTSHGVSFGVADRVSRLSPVSNLRAAFLGCNPIEHLLGHQMLAQLPPAQQAAATGRSFFPRLISGPFLAGLHAARDFAIVAGLSAAWASWMRGRRYVYVEGIEADADGDQEMGDGDRYEPDLAAAEDIGADTEALP